MNFKILIIEDEKKIEKIVRAYLQKEGFEVFSAFDGIEGLRKFNEIKPQLIILDLNLPLLNGEDVIREIKTIKDTPIIMLTSKIDEKSRVNGFILGADDYITKPFSPAELVQRVKVALKRNYSDYNMNQSYEVRGLKIDDSLKNAYLNDKLLTLTANEYKLLLIMLKNPDRVFSRNELSDTVFGIDYEAGPRNIDTYIKNIRQKIEDDPKHSRYIKTKRGLGYFIGGQNETT